MVEPGGDAKRMKALQLRDFGRGRGVGKGQNLGTNRKTKEKTSEGPGGGEAGRQCLETEGEGVDSLELT